MCLTEMEIRAISVTKCDTKRDLLKNFRYFSRIYCGNDKINIPFFTFLLIFIKHNYCLKWPVKNYKRNFPVALLSQ